MPELTYNLTQLEAIASPLRSEIARLESELSTAQINVKMANSEVNIYEGEIMVLNDRIDELKTLGGDYKELLRAAFDLYDVKDAREYTAQLVSACNNDTFLLTSLYAELKAHLTRNGDLKFMEIK